MRSKLTFFFLSLLPPHHYPPSPTPLLFNEKLHRPLGCAWTHRLAECLSISWMSAANIFPGENVVFLPLASSEARLTPSGRCLRGYFGCRQWKTLVHWHKTAQQVFFSFFFFFCYFWGVFTADLDTRLELWGFMARGGAKLVRKGRRSRTSAGRHVSVLRKCGYAGG